MWSVVSRIRARRVALYKQQGAAEVVTILFR
jgi:hypothetical protein